jgi:hypothetical protein
MMKKQAAKPHSYSVRFHECGFSSTWDVYVLNTDGTSGPVMVQAKFDPSFMLRASFATEQRAREFADKLTAALQPTDEQWLAALGPCGR